MCKRMRMHLYPVADDMELIGGSIPRNTDFGKSRRRTGDRAGVVEKVFVPMGTKCEKTIEKSAGLTYDK